MQNQFTKNWQKIRLGDLLEDGIILQIQDGNHGEKHPKQSDFVKSGDRIPFIMANDLNSGKIDFNNCNYISKKQADKLRIGFAMFGDVLLTHKGSLGLVSIVPKTEFDYLMLTPQVTYYRVDKERLDKNFLKYVFLNPSFQREMQNISPQSTRPYVGITAQRNLEINYIRSIHDQKKIASILSAFDDKIDVNNKIAKILEELAQIIFKEYFLESEGKKYSFFDLANYVNGGAFGNIINKEGKGLPLIKIADLNRGVTDNTEYVDKIVPDKYYVRDGDILFSWSGSLDLYIWCKGRAVLNQHIFNVVPKGNFSKGFLYFVLVRKLRYFKQIAGSKATTMGHIKKENLEEQSVIIPDGANLSIFDIIYRKLVHLKLENQKLLIMRDLLLPKLMKGEIRV